MFIRKKKNLSGSTSIQIVSKGKGRYKVVRKIDCATMLHEIEKLELLGKQEIERMSGLGHTLFGFVCDGLKGFITNSRLSNEEVIANYKNLWHIERAFRMSKTDLRIRPIYHRLRNRIEAHICIAFTAYSVYKELERALYAERSTLSLKKAAEITHNMYQLTYTLPESKLTKSRLLKMDDQQNELYQITLKKY